MATSGDEGRKTFARLGQAGGGRFVARAANREKVVPLLGLTGLGHRIAGGTTRGGHPNPEAFEKAHRCILSRRALGSNSRQAYKRKREDAYDERFSPYNLKVGLCIRREFSVSSDEFSHILMPLSSLWPP
jgi:hypothetical protein